MRKESASSEVIHHSLSYANLSLYYIFQCHLLFVIYLKIDIFIMILGFNFYSPYFLHLMIKYCIFHSQFHPNHHLSHKKVLSQLNKGAKIWIKRQFLSHVYRNEKYKIFPKLKDQRDLEDQKVKLIKLLLVLV